MPYCSKCGVEVDEGVGACPLCASPIQSLGESVPRHDSGPYPQHIIDPQDAYRLSKAERRRIGVELLALAAVLASGALLLVDMLPDADLGWSRYAVVSIALGWVVATAPLVLYGRIKASLATIGAAIVAYLLAIDALDGRLGWSVSLGIPIAIASYIALTTTAVVMISRKNKGLNMLGIGALGLAALLISIEAILRIGLKMSIRPYWSIVAALALVPVAVFLFFLHGRVLRGANLRKIFRL